MTTQASTPATSRRLGEQLTFAHLEQPPDKSTQAQPPAMFTKPALFTGQGHSRRLDWTTDDLLPLPDGEYDAGPSVN